MNLMIMPGMLVCSSFLISVCMFIVSKALLISSTTVIVRAGGAICYGVVYCVYCRQCRVLCFVPVLRGCVWYDCGYVRHTHSQHLSTSTQATTNDKNTHSNRMGYTEGDTHGYL